MFEVKRTLGGFSASWHDGAAFIDPDPFRAIELAANDEIRRLEAAAREAKRVVRRAQRPTAGGRSFGRLFAFADRRDADRYLERWGVAR